MPNHVINEILIEGIDEATVSKVRRACLNEMGTIDFGVLLPKPLNVWDTSVSSRHEEVFGKSGLDWARENWGTKWGPYGGPVLEATPNGVRMKFNTAWRPPFRWILALFHTIKADICINWMSEGDDTVHKDRLIANRYFSDTGFENPFVEESISDPKDPEYRRIHKMLWGVEEFEDDEEPSP